MKSMPKTLDSSPLIKLHRFDDVGAVVCCDSDLTRLTEVPRSQCLSQAQGYVLSGVVVGEIRCLQAAAFQFKLLVDKVHSQANIWFTCPAWPQVRGGWKERHLSHFFLNFATARVIKRRYRYAREVVSRGQLVPLVQRADHFLKSHFTDGVYGHHVFCQAVRDGVCDFFISRRRLIIRLETRKHICTYLLFWSGNSLCLVSFSCLFTNLGFLRHAFIIFFSVLFQVLI